jgi:hypothetical protein
MDAKGEGRRRTRAPRRDGAHAPGRERHSYTIGTEARRRLSVHAAMTGRSEAQVIEGLILDHCRRFVVSDRDRERGENGPGDAPGPAGQGRGPAQPGER